jgi:hypothetical protein
MTTPWKVAAVILIGFSISALGVVRARDRMDAEAAKRRVCAEALRVRDRSSVFVDKFVRPAEPCLALAVEP